MNMKKSLLLLGLLAAFNANANLITNGSFEDTTNGQQFGGFGPNFLGYTSTNNLVGWDKFDIDGGTYYAEVIDNAGNAHLPTTYGTKYLELDTDDFVTGNTNGGVSQSFSSSVGEEFNVSFFYTFRVKDVSAANSPATSAIDVFWNGNVIENITNADNTWKQFTGVFSANSLSTTFGLRAAGSADVFGAGIDNVVITRVAAVPEPETYGMMMMGLAMLGFASRRRKQ